MRKGLEGVRLNRFLRSAYREKRIEDISVEDGRVRILGVVIDVGEVEFVIADESSQISCIADDPSKLQGLKRGDIVRVFGFPLRTVGEPKLQVDIIQKLDGLNVQLYREVQQEISWLEGMVRW